MLGPAWDELGYDCPSEAHQMRGPVKTEGWPTVGCVAGKVSSRRARTVLQVLEGVRNVPSLLVKVFRYFCLVAKNKGADGADL